MLKKILKLSGAQELTKNEQKEISGGIIGPIREEKRCGGDGSFIYVNGAKVCCYIPSQNNYIC
ncbi:hypothetical protein FIA58_015350 [Flavobacterium jejuense]|uniref:Bacteriocin-type signal sequence n=1 Tax=Flavobacterium jejuense TaxID=1544455 RepID=A0ABX0IT68_9FLAO|nr:hypothetical protein [Flavobacterium jejuense]NHN27059.1 hypothetical protein [Flavobacterium jejuense]